MNGLYMFVAPGGRSIRVVDRATSRRGVGEVIPRATAFRRRRWFRGTWRKAVHRTHRLSRERKDDGRPRACAAAGRLLRRHGRPGSFEVRGKQLHNFSRRRGEAAFRAIESAVIVDVLRDPPAVLAVGGGAVTVDANVVGLRKAATVVWLTACPEILARRIQADPGSDASRPPLTGKSSVDEIRTVLTAGGDVPQCGTLADRRLRRRSRCGCAQIAGRAPSRGAERVVAVRHAPHDGESTYPSRSTGTEATGPPRRTFRRQRRRAVDRRGDRRRRGVDSHAHGFVDGTLHGLPVHTRKAQFDEVGEFTEGATEHGGHAGTFGDVGQRALTRPPASRVRRARTS